MDIREFNNEVDLDAIRDCVVALQDYEQAIDTRMPSGAEIADAYVADMIKQVKQRAGKLFVAIVDGNVVGYASLWARVKSGDIEDGDIEFGLIADLMVKEPYRGRGIGGALLDAAQAQAITNGVQWLRISVLAKNRAAYDLYVNKGFSDYQIQLEKRLTKRLSHTDFSNKDS